MIARQASPAKIRIVAVLRLEWIRWQSIVKGGIEYANGTSSVEALFQHLEVGDEFYLDGRRYRKRSNYSAVLVRLATGESPAIKINRMINPDIAVIGVRETAS